MQPDQATMDKAFQALETLDWGKDPNPLRPIDDAIVVSHGDAAARKALALRLTAVLGTAAPRAAKDYACRKLRVIGSAESVPALAALLPDKDLSHMARYALEAIPAPEAAAVLRDALPKLKGAEQIGVIGSLGARRDEASGGALAMALGGDPAVNRAVFAAIGAIGTEAAGDVLCAMKAADGLMPALADASLECAERLAADGHKAEATALYKKLAGSNQPKAVRLAAMRGLLSAAGK
jgi:hypothetical protein